ncbi:MAG: alpha/beta hydrolase [Anaerolineae bacterium]|nr:alpha/beta hydrolase [Anaerolineae bacterium]
MAFAKIGESKLYYEVAGEGPTVVLGHAGFVDSRMWDDQWQALTQDYRVIRYDMQGYGRSDKASGPISRRQELLSLLQQLDAQQAHLIGASMSGEMMLDFALEHPEMVLSLVTVNSTPSGFEMQGEPPRYLMEMFQAAQQGEVDRASELQMRIWIDGMYREPEQVDPGVREKAALMNQIPVRNQTFFIADSQPVNPLDPPAATRLSEIECPVLVVNGTLDHPEIRRAAEMMATQIPNARRATIEDAAHLPNMEKPAVFNQLILDFLSANG